ncbi:ribosomal maturation YjgA family protein [Hymenobacter seoulensis]
MVSRNRVGYGLLLALTMVLGLASRRFGASLPAWVAAYAGDTLWALLVFWLVGVCWPRWPSKRVAVLAAGFAVAIELSQLFQAPWLRALRHTTLGSLVLGHGFLWSDLLCYAVGVLVGLGAERLWLPENASQTPS